MTTPTPDLPCIVERLEKVWRQNRRLNQAGTLLLVVACSVLLMGQAAPKRPAPLAPANDQVVKLQKRVVELEEQLERVRSLATALNSRVLSLEIARESETEVTIDPAQATGYQKLVSGVGFLLISFKDASPYLDGYRVALQIGNPLSATFHGFKLKVKWGPRYDWKRFSGESYQKWVKTLQEKESHFTEALNPGTWNPVTLVLPNTKPDQLGYLSLSIETDRIELYSRP